MTVICRLAQSRIVEIEGSGSNFLRLKSAIISMGGSDSVISSSKGKLKTTLDAFSRAWDDNQFVATLETELKALMESLTASEQAHSEARDHFFDVLARESVEGVSPFWRELLKPHQIKAVEAMALPHLRGLCLFDEQGTGKTLTTIAAFDDLYGRGDVDTLFLVGPKVLVKTWKKEFDTFLKGKYQIVEVSGSPSQRMGALNKKADVYLASYETAASDFVAIEGAMRHKSCLLVVDESFMVKNERAERSMGVERIRRSAKKAFILCGTPAPNNAYDLVHQFNLADLGWAFRGFRKTSDADADYLLIEKIVNERGTFIRRTKEIVLPELASKDFEVIECPLTVRQSELYAEAKEQLILFLKKLDNTTFRRDLGTYFQKRAALTQISVSPALIGDTQVESGKYQRLSEIVAAILAESRSKKIVVWSAFTKSSDHIQEMLKDYGLVRVDGTNASSDERQNAIAAFQTDPSVRIFLGNPAAAGAGITLTAADTAIYVSFSNQAATYMQSLDRIHRIGQKSSVVKYKILISEGTIDAVDVEKLGKKQTSQSWILGDPSLGGLDLEKALAEIEGSAT